MVGSTTQKKYKAVTRKQLGSKYGNVLKNTRSSTGMKNSNQLLSRNVDTKSRQNLVRRRKG